MEITKDLQDEAQQLATIFLEHMPKDVYQRYSNRKLHEQLAHFYYFTELMKENH